MRCEGCPLSFWETPDYETGESDQYCAVTMDYIVDNSCCCRTNKWIDAQNIDALIEKYAEQEARCYAEYFKAMELENE